MTHAARMRRRKSHMCVPGALHPNSACHHNYLSGSEIPSRCTSILLSAQPLRIPVAEQLLCHMLLREETNLETYFSNVH